MSSVSEDQQLSQTCWWDKQRARRWLEALDNSSALILCSGKYMHCISTHFHIPWHLLHFCIYPFAPVIHLEGRGACTAQSHFLRPTGTHLCGAPLPSHTERVHRSDSYLSFTCLPLMSHSPETDTAVTKDRLTFVPLFCQQLQRLRNSTPILRWHTDAKVKTTDSDSLGLWCHWFQYGVSFLSLFKSVVFHFESSISSLHLQIV